MQKKIFITGGLGFVGRHLVETILQKTEYTVLLLVRSSSDTRITEFKTDTYKDRIEILQSDLLNLRDHKKKLKEVTGAIHLAADLCRANSLSHIENIETNVVGTAALIEALVDSPLQHCLIISSAAVYGQQDTPTAINESYPLNPINMYGASKLSAEHIANTYHKTKGVPITILRPFNIYGVHQKPPLMIPLFIEKLLNNEAITLNNGGEQTRDLVHVSDVISAILRILELPSKTVAGETYNLSTGIATSIKDIATLIITLMNKDTAKLIINPSPKMETNYSVGSSKKLQEATGWQPSIKVKDGIKEIIQSYE